MNGTKKVMAIFRKLLDALDKADDELEEFLHVVPEEDLTFAEQSKVWWLQTTLNSFYKAIEAVPTVWNKTATAKEMVRQLERIRETHREKVVVKKSPNLKVCGIVKNLVDNCLLEMDEDLVTLTIDSKNKALVTKQNIEHVRAALGKYFNNDKIQLKINLNNLEEIII